MRNQSPSQCIVSPFKVNTRLSTNDNNTHTRVKGKQIKTLCSQIQRVTLVKVHDLEQVVSSLPSVKFGMLYFLQLEIEENLTLKLNKRNCEGLVSL